MGKIELLEKFFLFTSTLIFPENTPMQVGEHPRTNLGSFVILYLYFTDRLNMTKFPDFDPEFLISQLVNFLLQVWKLSLF